MIKQKKQKTDTRSNTHKRVAEKEAEHDYLKNVGYMLGSCGDGRWMIRGHNRKYLHI